MKSNERETGRDPTRDELSRKNTPRLHNIPWYLFGKFSAGVFSSPSVLQSLSRTEIGNMNCVPFWFLGPSVSLQGALGLHSLHDGARETAALLQEGEPSLGERRGGLLSPGCGPSGWNTCGTSERDHALKVWICVVLYCKHKSFTRSLDD